MFRGLWRIPFLAFGVVLLGKAGRRIQARGRRPRKLIGTFFEQLEDRTVFAVTANLNGTTLDIGLSAAGDAATVLVNGPNIEVTDGAITFQFPAVNVASISALGTSAGGESVTLQDRVRLTGPLIVSGVAIVNVEGQYQASSIGLATNGAVSVNTGAALMATGGDVLLTAIDTRTGVDTLGGINTTATAVTGITVTTAMIEGTNIRFTASSKSTANSTGVFDGTKLANVANLKATTTAAVLVSGNSRITATGNVTVEAATTTTVTGNVAAKATGDVAIDGVFALARVETAATVTIADTTEIVAGGSFKMSTLDTVDVTLTADGKAGGATAAGGVIAISTVSEKSESKVTGTAQIKAAEISITSESAGKTATLATSTAAGASQNSADTKQELAANDAKTSSGAISLAGAIAITNRDRTTRSTIDSAGPVVATGKIILSASTSGGVGTTADGSSTGGTTGVKFPMVCGQAERDVF